jgi:hypothetical protein
MLLPLCAPIQCCQPAVRVPLVELRVSSSKQSYFEIVTVSQLSFKDVDRINTVILWIFK